MKAVNRRLALNIKALYRNSDDMSLISVSLRTSGFVVTKNYFTSAIFQ